MSKLISVLIPASLAGVRLDKALHEALRVLPNHPAWSRSQVAQWISEGLVEIGGRTIRRVATVVAGAERVTVRVTERSPQNVTPYEFPLRILHEDEALLVLDKPSGISMHPGAGNQSRTLLNALVAHWSGFLALAKAPGIRAGIVHRLDKDTSGVVVIAKSAVAHAHLSAQFARRSIDRRYRALVAATPRRLGALPSGTERGIIALALGRDPRNRLRFSVVERGGKEARTEWWIEERFPHAALLQLKLHTGRTHQIRVHLAQVGCPVLGDPLYGDTSFLPHDIRSRAAALHRQALHAFRLGFVHPASGEAVVFESPLPQPLAELLTICRNSTRD